MLQREVIFMMSGMLMACKPPLGWPMEARSLWRAALETNIENEVTAIFGVGLNFVIGVVLRATREMSEQQ